jgi:GntR family transcriptional regulator/MocR family aminotransferase
MGARDRCAGDRGRLRRRGARAADLARFIDSGGLARHLRRVRPVCRARRDCLLAALGTHLPRIRPQGEAAGLHLLPRMPAGQDPGVISTAAETHGIMLEKAAWHWADPDTAPPAVLIGYGSVREDDLARGIESLRVSTKP